MSERLDKIAVQICLQNLVASDTDSDEDTLMEVVDVLGKVGLIKERKRRHCIKNYLHVVLNEYTDKEFITHFRIKRSLFNQLCSSYKESNDFINLNKNYRVASPEKHFAIFLWFAGHEGCCYRDIGDRFDTSISTVHDMIHRVLMFVSNMSPNVIKLPNDQQKIETASFFKERGFPNVVGCIDGTRIPIETPLKKKNDYIDRKGNVTVAFQGVCNEKKQFIDIFVGHPGSVHDSRLLRESTLFPNLNSFCQEYHLLGDSAYPCKTFLLTPYKDNGNLSTRQIYFNRTLNSCRVLIEHTFGILKQRFRQLKNCKLRDFQSTCHFIRACCVLHNLCDSDDLVLESEKLEEENYLESDFEGADEDSGVQKRKTLCIEMYKNRQ